ncbi:glucose-6-phosphate dehydrogenase [Tautonia plasticadhaerens]|uniref:Glucose-6-phosphate 1-dehydrogenase n=1 Tax=Tautonia plasticadhaerens TaxID=2527974 RepID=A0A518GZQ3_9BACT|nr:glucose-6-phosphate dehydrogenase [Tautonia plasticadhaerens]QDV34072.1 Glucose-6-phosphate 1-dehydrogenase [Tautonia plasticadhaerens]
MAAPSEAGASNPLREHLPRSTAVDPCAIVLFGSTGDLTHRKLAPALFELAGAGDLPSDFAVVGFGRRPWGDDQYRESLRETLAKGAEGPGFDEAWSRFAPHVVFVEGNLDDPAAYSRLKGRLEEVDRTHETRGNRLFYLAVGPEFFAPIVARLGEAGLIYPADRGEGPWSRVVVEKPFGHDLESARRLNHELKGVLDEGQIYRIDHYLGKETVQNILALRFGNAIFEPIWNRRHVASVQITVAEREGMAGGRGDFYDKAGAIRDMVQNHMMQLLCLVAMEPPVDLSADAVRTEKVKVLQSLPRWSPGQVDAEVVRARYVAGALQGEDVPGFLREKGVEADSATETYVALRVMLNTWRWAGVPFLLRTGKRLPKRATEIAIQFRNPPTSLFEADTEASPDVNQLILNIQPKEGSSLAFQAKVPGSRSRLRSVRMDFRYGTSFARPVPEAYQRLLLDVMLGDPTLFTRTDEVEAAWKFITPILDAWARPEAPPPGSYPAGSWGPEAADALAARDGIRWRRL